MKSYASIIFVIASLFTISLAKADDKLIEGLVSKSLECKYIESQDMLMTVCVSDKGARSLRSNACGNIEAALCWGNPVATSLMATALPLVKLAKDRGAFRDQGHCEEIARNAASLASTLSIDIAIASALAGKCGECVCRAAY